MSKKEQKRRSASHAPANIHFHGKSLNAEALIPRDSTVRDAKLAALGAVYKTLSEYYDILLDMRKARVVITPKPDSEQQKWTDLGLGATLTVSLDDADDKPLLYEYNAFKKNVPKNPNKSSKMLTEPEIKHNELKNQLQEMQNQLQEIRNQAQERARAHEAMLKEERQSVNQRFSDVSFELSRIQGLLNPLLIRLLMDDMRTTVVRRLKKGPSSWHDIDINEKAEIVTREIKEMRQSSKFAGELHSSLKDMVCMTLDDHSRKKERGNNAAHSESLKDISNAVLSEYGESNRDVFIDLYRLTYDKEPVL